MTDVLLTDAEERGALAACRALAQAGYRVSAASSRHPAATGWSRSCSERFSLPDPRDDPQSFVAGLEGILHRRRYATVLPASDVSLIAISQHRARLDHLTCLGLPPPAAVLRAVDKLALIDAAAGAGLATPVTKVCSSVSEALRAAEELCYPVVAKPARSFTRHGSVGLQATARVARDPAELGQVVSTFGTPFLIQRYEKLPLYSCSGVVASGQILAVTFAHACRTWPPVAGSFTSMESRPLPAGLASKIQALLDAVQWEGLFQVDMVLQDDGAFSVFDLNPRVFASLALDVAAGANLPAVWCNWLAGTHRPAVTARAGVRYRWEEGEFLHLGFALRRREFRTAAGIARPHSRTAWAHGRITDPAPLIARALYLARRPRRSRSGMPTTPEPAVTMSEVRAGPRSTTNVPRPERER
jgi:predicted ATP-grasp superfamily ATP-dependent carboligase